MNKQRLDNFTSAVTSLQEYVSQPIQVKRDLMGIVAGFGLALELGWKCTQDSIADLGYAERGPKPVLQAALRAGIIPVEQEPTWSQMLEDRNLATHTYNEAMAREIVARITATHLRALKDLESKLAAI